MPVFPSLPPQRWLSQTRSHPPLPRQGADLLWFFLSIFPVTLFSTFSFSLRWEKQHKDGVFYLLLALRLSLSSEPGAWQIWAVSCSPTKIRAESPIIVTHWPFLKLGIEVIFWANTNSQGCLFCLSCLSHLQISFWGHEKRHEDKY